MEAESFRLCCDIAPFQNDAGTDITIKLFSKLLYYLKKTKKKHIYIYICIYICIYTGNYNVIYKNFIKPQFW